MQAAISTKDIRPHPVIKVYMRSYLQAAPPPRRSLIEFEEEDPEELDRMEQERIQRSMKNLYSHARTVRRCLQYATKVLDRYDVSLSERERERERELAGYDDVHIPWRFESFIAH